MVKLSFAPEEDTSKDVFLEIRQREIYLHARDMIEADMIKNKTPDFCCNGFLLGHSLYATDLSLHCGSQSSVVAAASRKRGKVTSV